MSKRHSPSRLSSYNLFYEIIFTVIIISVLSYITYYVIILVRLRSRDTQRIADLNRLQKAAVERIKVSGAIPQGDYLKLKPVFSNFLNNFPQDPLNRDQNKYVYLANKKNFVFYVKMESANINAKNDSGKYNSQPLYYETGYGPDWQKLIPANLP